MWEKYAPDKSVYFGIIIQVPNFMKKKKQVFIGCSGYYYPQWKGTFYPQKLPPAKWLEHYSSVFNTVELNGTFYRVPKEADLKRQYNHTPDAFRFSVKMNRYITHTLKLKDSTAAIQEFQALIKTALKDKLHKFLFQLPPSFKFSEENLNLISENIPDDNQNVVELRHASWWNKEVESVFKKRNYVFCNVDYPGLHTYFMNTSEEFYLRLHGSPELFKSSYSDELLEKFYHNFPQAETYTVYFNNTYYDAAYKNALVLCSKFEPTLEKIIPHT